jgi:hypothetical protein
MCLIEIMGLKITYYKPNIKKGTKWTCEKLQINLHHSYFGIVK